VGCTVFPGSPVGDEAGVGAEFEAGFEFCAQGGRSGLSCAVTIPIKRKAKTVRSTAAREQWGVVGIET